MWIFARADLGHSAAVISVTGFAFLPEEVASCGNIGWVRAERIGLLLRRPRHARMQKPRCDCCLDSRLRGSGARKAGNDTLIEDTRQEDHADNSDSSRNRASARHLKASCRSAGTKSQSPAEIGKILAAK